MSAVAIATDTLEQLDLGLVQVHAANPRSDVGDLTDLTASIKEVGVVEPIVVVRRDGHFEAVAGSRRLAAAKKAGLKQIPARVMDLDEAKAAAIALIENLQRKDLNPLEEANGYAKYIALTGCQQKELAAKVGKAPSTIANALRLLDAAPQIQTALEKGEITAAHARVVMSLPEKALPLVDLKKDVSVSELTEQARSAQRAFATVERIRGAIEKAEAAGKSVTWVHDTIYVAGAEIDLARAFGEPKKKLAGMPGRGYAVPDLSTHSQLCGCAAVAIGYNGDLVPACVSPAGWKKCDAQARKELGHASPAKRKKAKTADDRRKEAERDTKAAIREADEALNFKKLQKYHPLKTDLPAALLKGGIAGEPARLVLFGQVVENSAGSNESKTWEVELWKKIAKLPLNAVREYVTKWAVAGALEEIRSTNRYKSYGSTATGLGQNNASVITQLVNAHYGVRAKAKKSAKRKAA